MTFFKSTNMDDAIPFLGVVCGCWLFHIENMRQKVTPVEKVNNSIVHFIHSNEMQKAVLHAMDRHELGFILRTSVKVFA